MTRVKTFSYTYRSCPEFFLFFSFFSHIEIYCRAGKQKYVPREANLGHGNGKVHVYVQRRVTDSQFSQDKIIVVMLVTTEHFWGW